MFWELGKQKLKGKKKGRPGALETAQPTSRPVWPAQAHCDVTLTSAVAGAAAATASSAPPRPSELGSGSACVRCSAMRTTRRWRRGRISWPERRRRAQNAATAGDRGDGDSAADLASRQAARGQEAEGKTTNLLVWLDLDAEARGGRGARRRRRSGSRAARRRRKEGGVMDVFAKKSS